MNTYILSEDADLDLDEIWEYIAEDSIDAADRWIGKLFDGFEAIGRTPGLVTSVRILPTIPFCSFR